MMSPMNSPAGIVPLLDADLRDLPEDVRAALEERREEIHSAEELRGMAEELMLRR